MTINLEKIISENASNDVGVKNLLNSICKELKIDNYEAISINNFEAIIVELLKITQLIVKGESTYNILNELSFPEFDEIAFYKLSTYLVNYFINNFNTFKSNPIPNLFEEILLNPFFAYIYFNDDFDTCKIEISIDSKKIYNSLQEFCRSFYNHSIHTISCLEMLCKNFDIYYILSTGNLHIKLSKILYDIIIHLKADINTTTNPISENIKYLPDVLIKEILNNFSSSDIINKYSIRFKIFSIIDSSNIVDINKRNLKFLHLDGIRIVNMAHLQLQINQQYINDHINSSRIFIDFRDLIQQTDYGWQLYGNYYCCSPKNNAKKLIIELKNDKIIISNNILNSPNITEMNYKYDDWVLNEYFSEDFTNKISWVISNKKYSFKEMYFQMVYLNNYNGIFNRTFNFTNEFNLTFSENKLNIEQSKNKNEISNFYGNNIKSLSLIVGKNGTGKTTTINFLKDIFFKLFEYINRKDIKIKKGVVLKDSQKYNSIIDSNCEFLVVFNIDKETYYITNINNICNLKDITPYKPDNRIDYFEYSKIIYFSSMLSPHDKQLFINSDNNSDSQQLSNSFKLSNYSESAYAKELINYSVDTAINLNKGRTFVRFDKELLYLIVFIKDHKDKLKHFIDKDISDLNIVNYRLNKTLKISEIDFDNKSSYDLITFDTNIEFLSSGQYAKLSFISKLYWVIKGFHNYSKYFDNLFDVEHVLQNNQSAIIFIDEGELYYHPEWQRRYISTLLDLVNNADYNFNIQVIISSNSPFMISDVLSSDVTYISETSKINDDTFGQNIHRLLWNNFFMDYTIGEYSRNFISELTNFLTYNNQDYEKYIDYLKKYYNENEINELNIYDKLLALINQISEIVYRNTLLELLDNTVLAKNTKAKNEILSIDKQIEELQKKKESIENKNDKLRRT